MTYQFGPFRYDALQRLLFRGDDVVPLVPKAIDTLHVLLERRGTIVEKSDLMKLVWPDTIVEDVGLARNISILRKALEEDPERPYIETIPRRGYRFTAEVAAAAPSVKAPWAIVTFCALIVAAFVYFQFYVPSRYLPPGVGIAVVPFESPSAQGLNELLVTDLAKLPGVQVVAPSTVRRHQRVGISMGLMGRLLGLQVLVEGAVQMVDGRPRTTARLVDVHTGKVIWAETYDNATQEVVAHAIAAAIGDRISPAKNFRRNSEASSTRNPAILEGR